MVCIYTHYTKLIDENAKIVHLFIRIALIKLCNQKAQHLNNLKQQTVISYSQDLYCELVTSSVRISSLYSLQYRLIDYSNIHMIERKGAL